MGELSDFFQPLLSLEKWAEETGHSYGLVGGLAVSSHAISRSTEDIDVLVVTIEEPGALLDSLRPFGFAPFFEDSAELANRGSVLVLRHASTGVKVDMMLAGLPMEETFVAEAETLSVAGVRIPVIAVEHLIVMKLLAMRPQDEADLHELIKANPALDAAAVRELIADLAAMMERPDLIDEAERYLAGLK